MGWRKIAKASFPMTLGTFFRTGIRKINRFFIREVLLKNRVFVETIPSCPSA